LTLAAVRDLREFRDPVSAEELEQLETDVLAGFVLARASAGVADGTIRGDVGHLDQMRAWFGRPLWDMEPADADGYFGKVLRGSPSGTRLARAQALTTYFLFLELRHKVEIHRMTGRVVECPIDEMNRPRGSKDAAVRIPPTELAARAAPQHGVQHVVGDDRRPAAVLALAGRGVESFERGLADVLPLGLQRGRAAMDDLAILPAFTGTLVTDALASYTIYGDAQALCGAHVLRELIAVTEDVRRDSAWAKAMIDVLIEAKDAVADAAASGQSALAPEALTGFQDRYRQAALCGIAANPYSGTGRKPRARALAERLRDRTAEYQRYMTDFAVPFDNNAAERDLRMVKAQQKISGSWRTLTGARRFARIRSYISTVRKHGINPLTALRDLFAGRPWMLPATS